MKPFVLLGLSIKCYNCMPGVKGGGGLGLCKKPTNYTTCTGIKDACMTVSYEYKVKFVSIKSNIMMCGVGSVCDIAGKANCVAVKKAANVTVCKYGCCKEDLCNNKSLLENAGRRGIAHFGAISAALLLCLFSI